MTVTEMRALIHANLHPVFRKGLPNHWDQLVYTSGLWQCECCFLFFKVDDGRNVPSVTVRRLIPEDELGLARGMYDCRYCCDIETVSEEYE